MKHHWSDNINNNIHHNSCQSHSTTNKQLEQNIVETPQQFNTFDSGVTSRYLLFRERSSIILDTKDSFPKQHLVSYILNQILRLQLFQNNTLANITPHHNILTHRRDRLGRLQSQEIFTVVIHIHITRAIYWDNSSY